MITYEVRVSLDPALVERYERYMIEKHIPDVLDTECFAEAHFERSPAGGYRVRYIAKTQADVDRYLAGHAQVLRDDWAREFPTGATVAREMWELVHEW